MGYMSIISPCISCGTLISYNPELVPSIRVRRGPDGQLVEDPSARREPVCEDCIERANPIRIANGLEPIVPKPGAYEPAEDMYY